MALWLSLNSQVPELDQVAHSSGQLSTHTQNEAMHNMSVHQLPLYYQPQWVTSINCFSLMINVLQISMYPNIAKHLTLSSVLIHTNVNMCITYSIAKKNLKFNHKSN